MQKRPKVSFCFTTFKRYEILRETLESVRLQTFPDFEVIVSDNDPGQSGRAIVESFDERFRYFANPENLGMKKSFNKSLERSSGEYIVMIADDDPVYPDMLETLLKLTETHPGYGMYMGGCNWYCTEPDLADFYNCKVGVNSCLAHRSINDIQVFDGTGFLRSFFRLSIFPHHLWSTLIVKREVIIEMGGVPDYGTAFLGDYAFMSLMGAHSGCVVINKALGHQTVHKQNFGRSQNDQLLILGPNFMDYISERLSKRKDWPVIRKDMEHFTAVWLVRHLNFLQKYSLQQGDRENYKDLRELEKKLFALPFLKPYRIKYLLLSRFPALHNRIVAWKAKNKTKDQ